MPLAQPDEPESPDAGDTTDLFVGSRDEEEIAGGLEPLADERRERDRIGRNLILHVECSATPDLAVDEVARPRIALPLRRIREHRVRMADERERRTVAALDARDEVRPLGR